jgi:flagellar protein FlgJ
MINSINASLAGGTGSTTDAKATELEKLKSVAKQFEAVFLRQIIGSSREAKLADDVFGSDASDQFQQMQDSHLADSMSDKGVFGIADLLVKQFGARLSPAAASTSSSGMTLGASGGLTLPNGAASGLPVSIDAGAGLAIDTAKASG